MKDGAREIMSGGRAMEEQDYKQMGDTRDQNPSSIWDKGRDDAWHKNMDSFWDKKRDDVWHRGSNNNDANDNN